MKKKIGNIIFAALILCTLVGCGSKKESLKEAVKPAKKGNCNAVECIKQINTETTVEEVNNIMGFEGITKDGKENTYYWEITDKETIKVVFDSNNKATITADIEKSTIADKKVDFSKYSELQKVVRTGISYDEFKTYIGNVDGVITEKSDLSTKYTWVSKSGEYLNASFSNSTNKCRFVTGRIQKEK